jgi:hypothetical protein
MFFFDIFECSVPLFCLFELKLFALLWIIRAGIVRIVDIGLLHYSLTIVSPLHLCHLAVRLIVEIFLLRWPIALRLRVCFRLGPKPVFIVFFSKVRLAEDIIGFVEFLEDRLISISSVRMILLGQKIKTLLNLMERCLFVNLQYLVVILSHVNEGII